MDDLPTLHQVLAALRTEGVREVRATYSGCDDEGFLDDIALLGTDGSPRVLDPDDPRYAVLEEALEGALEPGWESGEGGRGWIALDVWTRRMRGDHTPGYEAGW